MSQTKINVAIVDNDEGVLRAIERLLRASGFAVQVFPSAEKFLAAAPHPPPDCLLLDIQLGGMSGLELQQKLRETDDQTPIIFLTAHDAPDLREKAQRAGCSAYLIKPVSESSLIEAIKQAVKSHG